MADVNPEKAAKQVLVACADCDVCRFLIDASCLFFPEFRLQFNQLTPYDVSHPIEIILESCANSQDQRR